jgi:hypothetical protein
VKVAEFVAAFKILPDPASMRATTRAVGSVRSMLLGLGAAISVRSLTKAFIGFNAEVENSKINIQSMLALARKNTLNENLTDSVQLYENLRKRAAELPGTVTEYVNAASKLTYPIISAGLSMKDLEDLTIGTIVAAKGLGYHVGASIRDIAQGLEGRFGSVDFFLKALLEPKGFAGEEGRARFRSKSKAERAAILKDALTQGAIAESAIAQSKTMTGQWDKAREQLALFLGRVGLPLFTALKEKLTAANVWLDKNRAAVEALADRIAGALSVAFGALGTIVMFIASHGDVLVSILWGVAAALGVIAVRSMLAALPVLFLIARVAVLTHLFRMLRHKIGDVGAAVVTVVAGVMLFNIGRVTRAVWGMVAAWRAARAASAAAGVAQGAGAAINGLSSMALGPAGPAARVAPTAARGAGAGAAAGMGALGAIGLPFLAAMAIDEFIPRNAQIDSVLGNWGAMRAMTRGEPTGKLGAPIHNTNTVNVAGDTITINGVTDVAEVERMLDEREQRKMRHAHVALGGVR